MIPEDGEGSTHLITIDVEGCRDPEEARAIARAVADSPLVKTAIHGADPNWGRIVSAAGYSGVPSTSLECRSGSTASRSIRPAPPWRSTRRTLSARIKSQERDMFIRLVFTRVIRRIRFWTCDLTAEYIHLNADYTT